MIKWYAFLRNNDACSSESLPRGRRVVLCKVAVEDVDIILDGRWVEGTQQFVVGEYSLRDPLWEHRHRQCHLHSTCNYMISFHVFWGFDRHFRWRSYLVTFWTHSCGDKKFNIWKTENSKFTFVCRWSDLLPLTGCRSPANTSDSHSTYTIKLRMTSTCANT